MISLISSIHIHNIPFSLFWVGTQKIALGLSLGRMPNRPADSIATSAYSHK
jgi:hypothetical protein